MIHRKNTLAHLRAEKEKYLGGSPEEQSVVLDTSLFELAMELIEEQDKLIQKLGGSLKASRQNVRKLSKIINEKSEVIRKKDQKFAELNKTHEYYSTKLAKVQVELGDAKGILTAFEKFRKKFVSYKKRYPTSLMSITEQIKHHEKERK